MATDFTNPKEIIILRAPQYAVDPRLDDLILMAERQTSACFGDDYATAVALRVLNGLALEGENGGNGGTDSGSGIAGVVKSLKEGDITETRGNMSGNSQSGGQFANLGNTVYGNELIALIRANFGGTINRFSKC